MKRKFFVIFAPFSLILFAHFVSPTNATVVRKLSDEEMVSNAQTIVIGTCTSIKSEWNEERTKIFTYITIVPKNILKGSEPPQEIIIKQLGGEVGEIGMHVEGISVFEEGEEAFLFLKQGRKGFQSIVGFSQGKLSIKTDPDTQRKILYKRSIQYIRTPEGKLKRTFVEIKSDKKLFLDEYTGRIQNIIQRTNK